MRQQNEQRFQGRGRWRVLARGVTRWRRVRVRRRGEKARLGRAHHLRGARVMPRVDLAQN